MLVIWDVRSWREGLVWPGLVMSGRGQTETRSDMTGQGQTEARPDRGQTGRGQVWTLASAFRPPAYRPYIYIDRERIVSPTRPTASSSTYGPMGHYRGYPWLQVWTIPRRVQRRVEVWSIPRPSLARRGRGLGQACHPARGGVTLLATAAHVRHDGRGYQRGGREGVPGQGTPRPPYTRICHTWP